MLILCPFTVGATWLAEREVGGRLRACIARPYKVGYTRVLILRVGATIGRPRACIARPYGRKLKFSLF